MSHLEKPRGKGFALRMTTPSTLVGTENPWTGKPFGKTIKLGLSTRSYAEAIRIRDMRIGQIRQLEIQASASFNKAKREGVIDLSDENIEAWREHRAEVGDKHDLVLTTQLERAAEAGFEVEAARFSDLVLKGKIPIDEALERYLKDRAVGNSLGLDPLKPSTMTDVRSSVKHLKAFLGENATLSDVNLRNAFQFRAEYLPSKLGLSPVTVEKHLTHLRQFWAWAISNRRILRGANDKPALNPWISDEKGVSTKRTNRERKKAKRKPYTPEQVSRLFLAESIWGNRKADVIRLALVTGVRVNELASLKLKYVRTDGSGFTIPDGKTENARRFIPLVYRAQELMSHRITLVEKLQTSLQSEDLRLFPEWPIRPSSGKVSSVSQWFSRFRDKHLGEEFKNQVVMHSFRHTWGTLARQAKLPRDIRQELGGWAKGREAMDEYDHGLSETALREWQQDVWCEMQRQGYLDHF